MTVRHYVSAYAARAGHDRWGAIAVNIDAGWYTQIPAEPGYITGRW